MASSGQSRSKFFSTTHTSNDHYHVKSSGYRVEVDGYYVEPIIVQPTPKGARIIVKNYSEKYGITISVVDHSNHDLSGDNINQRFRALRDDFNTNDLVQGKPIGILLMHSLHHAVPVIFSWENDSKYLIIFDSTSGNRKRGYHYVANLFPEFNVLLNNGTRQADNGSCVTDGICVLKDALRIQALGTYLFQQKIIANISPDKNSIIANRIIQPIQLNQDNFFIFHMPEELLKSAQISTFVDAAKPNLDKVIGSKDAKLHEHREKYRTMVLFNGGDETRIPINRYSHAKSQMHAELIDRSIKPQNASN